MAESLGRATFDVLLDTTAFRAGIEQVRTLAQRAGQGIENALGAKASKGTLAALDIRITSLKEEIRLVEIGSAKYKELAAAIRTATGERKKVEGDLSGGGALGGFGDIAGQIGLAVGAAGVAAGAFDQLKQLDAANAAVRTLGINSADLAKELSAVASEIGNNVSQVKLTQAAYDVASSGFATASDAAKVLKASALGAVGGFAELNTVADATTSVLNAYGLSADSAGAIVDQFIQTQNDGKIVVSQYADQIGRVAPIAAAAGVSIEELNAAVASATAQGVPVESTFAGLRQAIAAIVEPTAKAQEEAERLGLDFNLQALQAKGLGEVLKDVATRTQGSAESTSKLFGSIEAVAAIQPLLNDGLVKYTKNLENQRNSVGAAAKASQENSTTISQGIVRIGNALSDLVATTDVAFGPLVGGFLNTAAAAVGLKPLILGVAAAVTTLAIATQGAALAQKALAVASAVAQTVLNPANAAKVAIALGVGAATAAAVAAAMGDGGKEQAKLGKEVEKTNKQQNNATKLIESQKLARQKITNQQLASLSAEQSNLKAQEARLGFYSQEYQLIGQINKVRADAAIGRSDTIKSLLDQELSQAQKLATNDAQRRALELEFGQRKFNQTVAEFDLKAIALGTEQQAQQASLAFEQQKLAAAGKRAVIEAEIALSQAKQQNSEKGTAETQRQVELAQQNLDLIKETNSQEQGLGALRQQLLADQQAAARDQLSQQRLLALNSQAEFASKEQQAQLQADVNAELSQQASYVDAAAVSARNFKAQLQEAAQARGELSTSFQAQINTVIDGSQQFSQMNSFLSTIATNTAKAPVVNVTVNNSAARGNSSGAVVSGTGG